MAKKDKDRDSGRNRKGFPFGEIVGTIVVLPEPKGKLRNLFAERGMIPKPKRTCDCGKSKRGAAESGQDGV